MRNLLTELLPSVKGEYRLFADDDDEVKVMFIFFIFACPVHQMICVVQRYSRPYLTDLDLGIFNPATIVYYYASP